MRKIIIIFLGLSLCAFGMSYAQFKKYTLKHAKTLQKQRLSIKETQEKNNILLRAQNPTIGIEALHFNVKPNQIYYNYATSISQNIRTDSYYHGLERKASALLLLQNAYVKDGKSAYIQELEKLYTQYVYEYKFLKLLKEEYSLSQKITNIIKQRYEKGSENKVAYLQAKTNTMTLKTQMYGNKQEVQTLYYQLLAIAGLSKKISLEKKFIYSTWTQTNSISKANNKQKIMDAKMKILESQVLMNESSINSYEVYTGIENEPDQSIIRLGVNVALPVFNNKDEEKQLARLQMQQLSLDKEQLSINLYTQKKMLKASIDSLSKQYTELKSLKKEQLIINHLLQEGDKISKNYIFILLDSQGKIIQTKKYLLQTKRVMNDKQIELHFMLGDYNE